MKILVAYHSEDGHTERLARAIAEGVRETPDAEVTVKAIQLVTTDDLRAANGILLGCPVYGGTVSHQMKHFMDVTMGEVWAEGELAGKVGGAFASSGGQHGGIESTLETILRAMLGCSMVVAGPYIPQEEVRTSGSAVGATFVADEGEGELNDADRRLAHSLGRRVAELAGALEHSKAGKHREGSLRAA